jgi:YHS domain-containing protein
MRNVCIGLCAVAVLALTVFAAEEKKEEKFSAKCPVSGKDAVKTATADYKGAKVYFCCENCPKAFAGDTAKYATKANAQLVSTGQAKQTKCPLTGRAMNAAQTVEVSGVKVTLCCANCKGKVAGASGDAQAELVFADAPFGKGFEVAKAEKSK